MKRVLLRSSLPPVATSAPAMTSRLPRKALLMVVLALTCAACGGSSSSPTSPTPAPAPVANLTFESNTAGYAGVRSYSFTNAGGGVAGQIAINVMANEFNLAVSRFRGTVLYDSRVVELVNYSEGDWMKQSNAIATFSVTSNAARNGVVISVDKPTSTLGSTGSGVVLTLRFKPVAGVTSGSSQLQWTDTHAYNFRSDDQLYGTQGGTITIR